MGLLTGGNDVIAIRFIAEIAADAAVIDTDTRAIIDDTGVGYEHDIDYLQVPVL